MIHPDERLLKALLRLNGNSDFEIILKWISESLEEYKNNLIDANTDRVAGAAFELRELYNTVKQSSSILDNLEKVQSRRPNL